MPSRSKASEIERNIKIEEDQEDKLEEPKRLIYSYSSFAIFQNDLVAEKRSDEIIQTLPFISEDSKGLDEPLDTIRTKR